MHGLQIFIYIKVYEKLKNEQNMIFQQNNNNFHQQQIGLQENVKILYGLNLNLCMKDQMNSLFIFIRTDN
jgi:hypothetical protein